MPNVYSEVLFRDNLASPATVTAGPPPTGFVWVVRDMVFYNYGPQYGTVHGFVVEDSEGFPLWAVTEGECAALGSVHWEGRQVISGSDRISVTTSDSSWVFRICGYVLTLP